MTGDERRLFNKFFAALITVILITSCTSVSRSTVPDESGQPLQINMPDDVKEIKPLEEKPVETEPEKAPEPDAALNEEKKPVERKPMVALTFDDGPFDFTDIILDILERHGVHATFFLVGKEIEGREDSVIRMARNGNEIAGHSWAHNRLTELSNLEIKETIESTSALIEKVTGIPSPSFIRPTYGLVNKRVANVCAELGYALINWTVDPQDWMLLNADKVYDSVMKSVKENSIILLHEIFESTAAATERIVPALIEKGYELVTLSVLIYHLYGELKPGNVYGSPPVR